MVLPPSALTATNRMDDLVAFAFQVWNQSCSLTMLTATPQRRISFAQSAVVLSYNFQTVTFRAKFARPSTLDRIFLWTKPFTAPLWGVLAGSIVAFALAMPTFEHSRREGMFENLGSRLAHEVYGHSLFKASMGPSQPDTFEPVTAAGRAASALHAFGLMVIVASYTASLAAEFTTAAPPVQPVRSVSDLSSSMPACVRSNSVLSTLLNASLPSVFAALQPNLTYGGTSYGAYAAVAQMLGGAGCEGAILAGPEAAWLLGVNDTAGALCGAVPVGAGFGDVGMPLTFANGALSGGQMEAINKQLVLLRTQGSFTEPLRETFFPTGPRAACAKQDADAAAALLSLAPAQPLEVVDLAGAFILQGIGLGLGALLHVTKPLRQRLLLRSSAGGEASGGAEAAEGKGG